MKLINFFKFNELNYLRQKMGAPIADWEIGLEWQATDSELWRRLRHKGIDVKLEEIEIAEDKTFEYKGRKVIVYIRDQYYYEEREIEYKFHIAWCKTLEDMKRSNRYEKRYVVTNRTDGKFVVNIIERMTKKILSKANEKEMRICINCLRELNYNEYNIVNKIDKKNIYKNFSITEYFEKYDTKIDDIPKHTPYSMPLNIYSEKFPEISRDYRESQKWKCEKCGRDLSKEKHKLHTHHINELKYDNKINNLKALCEDCHKLEHSENNFSSTPRMNDFLKKMREFEKNKNGDGSYL